MTKQRGDLLKRNSAQRIDVRARSSNRGRVGTALKHVWLLLFERDGDVWVVAGFLTRREAEREAKLNRKRAVTSVAWHIPHPYLGTSRHFGRVFVRKAVLA